MPHADSSLVPETIQTKSEFWEHVYTQLQALIDGQRFWISNLANASSLIYNSLLAFPKYFGQDNKAVNWCGFYIHSRLFPLPKISTVNPAQVSDQLLLGPFCGKPACQFIGIAPGKARGVCADAFLQQKTLVVPNVDLYPGHIACDGETKSEIVVPLILETDGNLNHLGVLDLDCLLLSGFDDDDKAGLEKIARLLVNGSDW
ncbi:GAF domain-like protein [Cyathus striatus]|nr:GAF domain-like protein [Cyathus striatus]